MAIYMFDLVWKVMVELGVAKTGTATGGTTTTCIDTNGLRLAENDYFNEGTLFVLRDSAGAGAAPEKQYSKIKDFTQTSKTIEVYDAFTAAVASGDKYGVANRRYPLYLVEQKINNQLFLDGYIPGEDTSLTTVADQLEYTLPSGVSRDLRQVLFAGSDDSNANDWVPVVNYDIQKTATGTGDTLVLSYELPAGQTMWLRYGKQHDELTAYDSELDEAIHPDRIVYSAVAEMLRWYRDRTRLRHLGDSIDYFDLKAARAKEMHPLPVLPAKSAKITRFNRTLQIGSKYYTSEG
jgi:hypothetical protein